jgi:uncharacterized protein YwgA
MERGREAVASPASKPHVELDFDWNDVLRRARASSSLGASDLILLLLAEGPIGGKVMLQKQVFLAYEEVFGRKGVIDPGFRPDRYGPYSQSVADLPSIMRHDGLVRTQAKGEGRVRYYLGTRGASTARGLAGNPLVAGRLELLKSKKASWDEWTATGVMTYIYRKYPDFATKTKVPALKWD